MRNKIQEERLDYLLDAFKEDSGRYRGLETGKGYEDKRMALRSLMNIRMPGKMGEEVLRVQDEFLVEEAREKGVVTAADIPTVEEEYGCGGRYAHMLSVWQGDITRLAVGAVVNAANSQMLGCFVPCHRCIDNAIHSAAGVRLREECSHYMRRKKMQYGPRYEEPVGQAVLTKGYGLPAEHVIHTVGPIVVGPLNDGLKKDLENCYWNVLACCVEHGIRTVAFCCISTGEFHFPNEEAADIAVRTVLRFLELHMLEFDRVIFNVFQDKDMQIYERKLKGGIAIEDGQENFLDKYPKSDL